MSPERPGGRESENQMADNQRDKTGEPDQQGGQGNQGQNNPTTPRDRGDRGAGGGEKGSQTFAGDQDDRESRQTAEQQGEVPRPGTQQGDRHPEERDASHRIERGHNT